MPKNGLNSKISGHEASSARRQNIDSSENLKYKFNFQRITAYFIAAFLLIPLFSSAGCGNDNERLRIGKETCEKFIEIFKECPQLQSLEYIQVESLPLSDLLDAMPYKFEFKTGLNPKMQVIELYVFAHKGERLAAEELIADDVYSTEGIDEEVLQMVWQNTPHIYSTGNIIINYIGNDSTVKRYLDANFSPLRKGGIYKGPLSHKFNCMLLSTPGDKFKLSEVNPDDRAPGPFCQAAEAGRILAMGYGETINETELYIIGDPTGDQISILDEKGQRIDPMESKRNQCYTLYFNGEFGNDWPVEVTPPIRLEKIKDNPPAEFNVAALSLMLQMETAEGISAVVVEMPKDPMGKALKAMKSYHVYYGVEGDIDKTVKMYCFSSDATRDLAISGINSDGSKFAPPNENYDTDFQNDYYFYKFDSLIVVYEGEHQKLIRSLNFICGFPIVDGGSR